MEMCFFVFLCAVVCVQSVYVPKLDAIWMKKNGKSIFDKFIVLTTHRKRSYRWPVPSSGMNANNKAIDILSKI